MTASLSEILREETLKKAKNLDRISRCRPLVLSLWAEIDASLQDGWSLRSVWNALHETGKYPSSYESFRANVRALQETGGKVEAHMPSGKKAAIPEKKPEIAPASQASPALKDFSVKGVDWDPDDEKESSIFSGEKTWPMSTSF